MGGWKLIRTLGGKFTKSGRWMSSLPNWRSAVVIISASLVSGGSSEHHPGCQLRHHGRWRNRKGVNKVRWGVAQGCEGLVADHPGYNPGQAAGIYGVLIRIIPITAVYRSPAPLIHLLQLLLPPMPSPSPTSAPALRRAPGSWCSCPTLSVSLPAWDSM